MKIYANLRRGYDFLCYHLLYNLLISERSPRFRASVARWDASSSQVTVRLPQQQFTGTHLYTWMK